VKVCAALVRVGVGGGDSARDGETCRLRARDALAGHACRRRLSEGPQCTLAGEERPRGQARVAGGREAGRRCMVDGLTAPRCSGQARSSVSLSPSCRTGSGRLPAARRAGKAQQCAGTAFVLVPPAYKCRLVTLYSLVLIEDLGESAERVRRRSRHHCVREAGIAGDERR